MSDIAANDVYITVNKGGVVNIYQEQEDDLPMAQKVVLLENATATGNAKTWGGGRGTFEATATSFASGNVSLEYKTQDGTWVAVGDDSTLTANGFANFELPAGEVRAAVSATGATAVYATLIPINYRR